MGVMKCSRNGCDNILCDRYSKKYGYICGECFIEMKEMRWDIESFMSSPKEGEINYNYEDEFPSLHDKEKEERI